MLIDLSMTGRTTLQLASTNPASPYQVAPEAVRVTPAKRSRSIVNGYTPFEDIVIEMTVTILGDTPTAVQTNYHNLINYFDAADQFVTDDKGSPGLFKIGLDPSSMKVSPIIGPSPDKPYVSEPSDPMSGPDQGWLSNVRLAFVVKGGLVEESFETVNGAANVQGTFQTVNFAQSADLHSPTGVSLAVSGTDLDQVIGPGILLLAQNAADMKTFDSPIMTLQVGSGTFNNTSDLTGSWGTTVKTWTPSVLTEALIGFSSGVSALGKNITMILCVKNKSASVEWTVRPYTTVPVGATGDYTTYGKPEVIKAGLNSVQMIVFSPFNSPIDFNILGFGITPSAGGGSIEIDVCYTVRLDNGEVSMTLVPEKYLVYDLGNNGVSQQTWQINIADRYLESLSPSGYFQGYTGITLPISLLGDSNLTTVGAAVTWTYICPSRDRSSGAEYYGIGMVSNGLRKTMAPTFTRRRLSLVPR